MKSQRERERIERYDLPHGAGRMMAGAAKVARMMLGARAAATRMMQGAKAKAKMLGGSTAARMMGAKAAATRMMQGAKAKAQMLGGSTAVQMMGAAKAKAQMLGESTAAQMMGAKAKAQMMGAKAAARMMLGAKAAATRMMQGAKAKVQMLGGSTAARMMGAKAKAQMMSAAKAALLIILIVALPLVATSCRDRDDEPSAGGRLVTVSRLRVSIDGMQSAAEMKAARSAEMNAVRNGGDTRGGVQSRDGGEIRNGAQIRSGGEIRNGGETRNDVQTRNGGEIRNGGNTRADASDPEPDKNGYVGAEKKKFVAGDVLHFIVALTQADYRNGIRQVSNAILQADGTTWLFDTPLVLPEDATKTAMIEVFYDGTKRRYTYYNNRNTVGDDTAANGNANAAYWDAMFGIEDGVTGLTTYPDLLYVWGASGDWTDITLTPDGTLAINPLRHDNSLVRISSIDNRLGAKVTAIHANTTDGMYTFASVSLYPAATTTSSAAAPSAHDASAAAANGTVGAIIGYTGGFSTYLQSFTVTLDDDHKVIVPVPDGNKGQGGIDGSLGLELYPGESYTYRLLLLPGSVSAEEVNGAAPSYQVRRDPAVPAGYIPIYTAEDLRKIGVATNPDEVKTGAAPIYAPAIVNGYLYTNASSALLDADAQKDPIVDPTTGAYTDSGYNADGGTGADATSDGSGKVGPLTFSLDARYILMNDIDLTPKDGPAVNKDLSNIDQVTAGLWTPIGDKSYKFTGRFHGNGFTIRGMTINSSASYLGLFGCTNGAVIYNVHMQDARVKCKDATFGAPYIGSLAGSSDYSTISLCSATGCAIRHEWTKTNSIITPSIAGLVGCLTNSTITRCYATACTLSGTSVLSAGGLVGKNGGILASCYTAGCTANCTPYKGKKYAFGGLVGISGYEIGTRYPGSIYGCYATHAKEETAGTQADVQFGSLVGSNLTPASSSSTTTITASYAINGASSTLGLVGENDVSGIITNCVSPFENTGSTGAIAGNDNQDSGGGSYWEIISNGNGTFSGGYAPLTDATAALANVHTLLVNSGSTDITGIDMGGGQRYANTYEGKLKTIPPGGLYTVKREWKASRIWGDTTPKSLTVVLPRIDWTYNGE